MKEIIKTNNLIKNFSRIEVLKGISFTVNEGEYVGIMGKSGCGKTTLLKSLGMIDRPTAGKIFFKELDMEELWEEELADIRRREIGFVFQDFYLMDKNPYELLGGEKQRVAICRALINDPKVIFADEPTGNLDSKSGKIVVDEFNIINREVGKTVIMVTHDPQVASNCKRILFLKDGMILEDLKREGTQEEFYQEILGKMKFL